MTAWKIMNASGENDKKKEYKFQFGTNDQKTKPRIFIRYVSTLIYIYIKYYNIQFDESIVVILLFVSTIWTRK